MDRTRRFRKLKERRQVTTSGGSPSLLGAPTGARALPRAAGGEMSGPGRIGCSTAIRADPHLQDLLLGPQHRAGTILPGTRRAAPHTPGVPQTTRRSAFIAGAQPTAANKTSPEHLYLDPSLINCLYLLYFHMPFS